MTTLAMTLENRQQFVATLEDKEQKTPQITLSITCLEGHHVLITRGIDRKIDKTAHPIEELAVDRAWQIFWEDFSPKYSVIRVNPETLPNDPDLLKLVIAGMQGHLIKLETHIQKTRSINY